MGSIPGSGRSPGEGHCKPLQYSCRENPVDRGAWWATVHRVAKSQTRLKQLSIHTPNKCTWGLPRWLRGKESACQVMICRRRGFNPWVRKIPWRRKRQPTPVFLLEKSHGWRSLAAYSPWNHEELDTTEQLRTHTHTQISVHTYRTGFSMKDMDELIWSLGLSFTSWVSWGLKNAHLSLVCCIYRIRKKYWPFRVDVNFRKICNWMLIQCPAYYSKGSIDGYKYC